MKKTHIPTGIISQKNERKFTEYSRKFRNTPSRNEKGKILVELELYIETVDQQEQFDTFKASLKSIPKNIK